MDDFDKLEKELQEYVCLSNWDFLDFLKKCKGRTKKAEKIYGKRERGVNRIQYDDNGELDEIVEHDTFVHLERMDDGYWFLCVGDDKIRLHILSDTEITINVE